MTTRAMSLPLLAALAFLRWGARGEELVDIYIGSGCFWHVQKEINLAEEKILGRTGDSITGITGYAGGLDDSGKICYTNYGDKGHTEVVLIRQVPRTRLPDFVRLLWPKLFPGGDKSDYINRGPSYRAALGLPGGASGALFSEVNAAQPSEHRASLEAGAGNDEETIDKQLIHMYDTDTFPFHQAELYHQFHDYGGDYRDKLVSREALRNVECPSELAATANSPVGIALLIIVSLILLVCLGAAASKYGVLDRCRGAAALGSKSSSSSSLRVVASP